MQRLFLLFFIFPFSIFALSPNKPKSLQSSLPADFSVCLGRSFTTFEKKLVEAKPGDFVVTEQNKIYSLLHLHSINDHFFTLEEVSIPKEAFSKQLPNWKKWIEEKAPGHTSWIMVQIDRKNHQISECFSFSKNSFLSCNDFDCFLTTLLVLPLDIIPKEERKKIGIVSSEDGDTRKIWNPPIIREGKKIKDPLIRAYKTIWPKDETKLSKKNLQLYFDESISSFPFPYWIEVSDGSNTLKIRSIDSGRDLKSPFKDLPKRRPEFIGTMQKRGSKYRLAFKTPSYLKELDLFALDIQSQENAIHLDFVLIPTAENEIYYLEIDETVVSSNLLKKHPYRFLATFKNYPRIIVETKETWQY